MTRRSARARPTLHKAIKTFTRAAYHQAILDAAERVFVREGYHEAKMADVAAETGVSVGTLYNYFPSKELVFASIIRRGKDQLFEALEQAAKQSAPLPRLREMLGVALSFIEERGALFSLYTRLGITSESDIQRLGGEEAEQGFVRFLSMLAKALEEAARAGLVRTDIDPAHLASALAGISNGYVAAWLRSGREESIASRVDDILKLFLEGAEQ
jgi:AcrR family transcriptional regulator